ncbi:hypothetical protein [Nitratifractor sp.]
MFIIDSDHRLIAAEAEDLTRWGVNDIYEAAQAFSRGTLRLDPEQNLFTLGTGESVTCHTESMESLLGSWTLCRFPESDTSTEPAPATESLQETPSAPAEAEEEELLTILPLEEAETETEETPASSESTVVEEEEFDLLQLEEPQTETEETPASLEPTAAEEEEFDLLPLEEPQTETEETPASSESTAVEEEEFDLLPLEEPSTSEETAHPTPSEEVKPEEPAPEELMDLLPLEEESEEPSVTREESLDTVETASASEGEALEELLPFEESEGESLSLVETISEDPAIEAWEEIASEFHPDLQANARKIALDYDEYAELLREFVSDSRGMQERLLSSDAQERKDAVSILKDAVALLYLQPLDKLLSMLDQAPEEKRSKIVETYTHLLEQLHSMLAPEEIHPEAGGEPHPSWVPGITSESGPETTKTTETAETVPETKEAETVTPPAEPKASEAAAEVDVEDFLKGVKPVAIEFSLHLAADELNLPEELVLEFIQDFDNQGHQYLPVLIEAYQSKDLKRLQETAHMLKGAASNLRIEAMVDNLYDLQFDNEIERAPERIRLFAGQLMSLDKYLEQMNRK